MQTPDGSNRIGHPRGAHALVVALAVHAAWGAGSARAATYCAESAFQLQSALNDASDGGVANGSDNTILVAADSFVTSGGPFTFGTTSGHALTIEGGYDAGCAHASSTPGLSVLDGGGLTRVLTLQTNGALTIRHLTLRNAFYSGSAGAAGQVQLDPGGSLTFEGNVVRDNVSGYSVGGFVFIGSGTVRLENNLFVGNTAPTAAAFATGMGDNSTIYVTNNTISDNTDTTDNNWVAAIGGGSTTLLAYVTNTVSWNNHGTGIHDFYLYGFQTASFSHDAYTSIVGNAAPDSGANLIGIDPQFAGAGDYHLRSTSPLLRAGTIAPAGGLPGTDLEGNPRSIDGKVDLGAYENVDVIFANGFETP